MKTWRVPLATYRLQLNLGLRFADVQPLVPYFHDLGITDLYLSPISKARHGSPHGYDVVDHSSLNPDLGSEADLEALSAELARYGMGLVIDIVPNHMAITDESNRWWWDVLENGPGSPYAKYFDIDWTPPKPDLTNKVLLPILGDQYGKVLENGEIRLLYEAGAFLIACYDHRLPVAPRSSTAILEPACERVRDVLGAEDAHLVELESIITALKNLPPRTETDPERVRVRQREKEVAKRRLAALTEASATVQEAIEQTVAEINGRRGDPHSFDRLEALLAHQAYRLSYWRVATDEINYRRFFDINALAAIRVEEPEVFEAVHAVVFRLMSKGWVTGLRVDHPDGLFDPVQYFLDLQQRCYRALSGVAGASAEPPQGPGDRPSYVVAEKILVRDERLRPDWAVHGTTGYDFLNLVNGLFIDPAGQGPIHDLYVRFTGQPLHFGDVAYASKKLILDGTMSSELHMLARRLDRISEQHRWSRDFTLFSLQEALSEIVACFPVYRSYIRASSNAVGEEDRRHILAALRTAKRRNPAVSESIFDFIGSVLLLQDPDGLSEAQLAERRNFVMRFQQITAPVMAKGLEDTAFYRAYPLASLNEVGGNPERFGRAVEEFHQHASERLANWPYTLLATSTHDTKRSEDVRVRIDVLSEMPRQWERAIQRWRGFNRDKKVEIEGAEVPDANEEYLLYQTLVGAWPLGGLDEERQKQFAERIERYMEKALKEAKLHTSWINPNEPYDRAVREFVRTILRPNTDNPFLADFQRFQARVAPIGMWNALSQLLLKLTAPGIPDIYQGAELWDFSLVDPDNRRPVDFQQRVTLLAELKRRESADLSSLVRELLAQPEDGRLKLYVTYKALNFRRAHSPLFLDGAYLPLMASGQQRQHLVAFMRRHGDQWVLVAVPRLLYRLSSSRLLLRLLASGKAPVGRQLWRDTHLELPAEAPEQWSNILSGDALVGTTDEQGRRQLSVSDLFQRFPLALLVGSRAS
jgi:(1->4)-alpha-D-glucan 1-alpha-D-glucosylmutase